PPAFGVVERAVVVERVAVGGGHGHHPRPPSRLCRGWGDGCAHLLVSAAGSGAGAPDPATRTRVGAGEPVRRGRVRWRRARPGRRTRGRPGAASGRRPDRSTGCSPPPR